MDRQEDEKKGGKKINVTICRLNGVQFTLEQATEAQRGVEVYLYSFFNLGARLRWVVNATPRLLYPREGDPVPIIWEAGWTPGPV
jgi:hypothetical protein